MSGAPHARIAALLLGLAACEGAGPSLPSDAATVDAATVDAAAVDAATVDAGIDADDAPTADATVADVASAPDVALDAPSAPDVALDAPPAPDVALDAPAVDAPAVAPAAALGATVLPDGRGLSFRVYSAHATRIELSLFARPVGADAALRVALVRDATPSEWTAVVSADALAAAGLTGTVYYGYRAWGPNWTYDAAWTPGSSTGFVADVDDAGNRFNPNKLLFDPYARELSHDPATPDWRDGAVYRTGASARARDSAPYAPKGVVLADPPAAGAGPSRPFRDEVIYEVHLRGLTMRDPDAPAGCAGTYAAAGARAAYLAGLGVTAVEFLPVQETQNDTNDLEASTRGDNYWGYSTLGYFAPDRRYACDRTPGGPTREFRAMVRAFHERGIKVYLDVVFNHTAEGGSGGTAGEAATLYSLRGLDGATYYQLARNANYYQDNNGVGANVATSAPATRRLVLDALRYWAGPMGVDGFRFDLASVLGNTCGRGCFRYERETAMLTAPVSELPARPADGGPGVDLIAEPWGIGDGTYQLGNFPRGWSEWNGAYRDLVRRSQNQLGVARVTPGAVAERVAGSSPLFRPRDRRPWASVNFLVAHDGFTLFDLYHCNGPNNGQPWPYGPSDGGSTDNLSWDQGGDVARQRQAARTGLALLLTSAGVPMVTGGDEMLRSLRCNNNPYNLDSERNWLDWSQLDAQPAYATFARRVMQFRAAHPALRPPDFWMGVDRNGDGLADLGWYRADGRRAEGAYMDDPEARFLAWRVDGAERRDPARSIYVAYNRDSSPVTVTLPTPRAGAGWFQAADTAVAFEAASNAWAPGAESRINDGRYVLGARAVAVLIER